MIIGLTRSKNFGFTLTEIVISIAILGIATLAILTLIVLGLKVDRAARKYTIATAIAQELIEQILNDTDFGSLQSRYNDATTVRRVYVYGTDSTTFKYNWRVEDSPAPLGANLKKINVNVYWQGTSGELSVNLVTLRKRRVYVP